MTMRASDFQCSVVAFFVACSSAVSSESSLSDDRATNQTTLFPEQPAAALFTGGLSTNSALERPVKLWPDPKSRMARIRGATNSISSATATNIFWGGFSQIVVTLDAIPHGMAKSFQVFYSLDGKKPQAIYTNQSLVVSPSGGCVGDPRIYDDGTNWFCNFDNWGGPGSNVWLSAPALTLWNFNFYSFSPIGVSWGTNNSANWCFCPRYIFPTNQTWVTLTFDVVTNVTGESQSDRQSPWYCTNIVAWPVTNPAGWSTAKPFTRIGCSNSTDDIFFPDPGSRRGWFNFFKDENTKYICVAYSRTGEFGTYTVIRKNDWAGWGSGLESISVYWDPLQKKWRLHCLDYNSLKGYWAESRNLTNGWSPLSAQEFPNSFPVYGAFNGLFNSQRAVTALASSVPQNLSSDISRNDQTSLPGKPPQLLAAFDTTAKPDSTANILADNPGAQNAVINSKAVLNNPTPVGAAETTVPLAAGPETNVTHDAFSTYWYYAAETSLNHATVYPSDGSTFTAVKNWEAGNGIGFSASLAEGAFTNLNAGVYQLKFHSFIREGLDARGPETFTGRFYTNDVQAGIEFSDSQNSIHAAAGVEPLVSVQNFYLPANTRCEIRVVATGSPPAGFTFNSCSFSIGTP